MANELIRGRQLVEMLTNRSGGDLAAGDVVVLDVANANSVTTTTVAGYTAGTVGVALEAIASGATGRILVGGYAPVVNLASAASIGDILLTHSVAGQAAPSAVVTTGAFGQTLSAGATPSAHIGVLPAQALGSGASALSELTDVDVSGVQDGDILVYDEASGDWLPGELPSTPAVTKILALGRSGALTATAGTMRLYAPWACTITNVRVSVGIAPTGADLIIDINLDGATVFTTQGNRPTIAAGSYADLSSTPDVTAISANSYLTVDVDAIGSTVAGSDLVVQVEVVVP